MTRVRHRAVLGKVRACAVDFASPDPLSIPETPPQNPIEILDTREATTIVFVPSSTVKGVYTIRRRHSDEPVPEHPAGLCDILS